MSAYVRVLTFRGIILTFHLLHLAASSHYVWFILLNISYLCREEKRYQNGNINHDKPLLENVAHGLRGQHGILGPLVLAA